MTPTDPTQSRTPLVDAHEFVGQAEWAEDNAPLLGCVEADFARQLETLLLQATEALEWQQKVMLAEQEHGEMIERSVAEGWSNDPTGSCHLGDAYAAVVKADHKATGLLESALSAIATFKQSIQSK